MAGAYQLLKQFCKLCQRETYHSQWFPHDPTCNEHSDWKPGKKRSLPDTMMLMRLTPEHKSPTEAELRRMNRMEKTMLRAADSRHQVSLAGYDWAEQIFERDPDTENLDPDKVYCSYCGRPTQRLDLTRENKPRVRFRNIPVMDSDGNVELQEKMEVVATTVNACPDCCLNVRKPITVQRV